MDGAAAGEQEAAPSLLSRWGLRFPDPATEAAYRAWHVREVVPFTRVSLRYGRAGYLVVLVGIAILLPAQLRLAALLILGLEFPLSAAGLVATYRPGLARWMDPLRAAAIAVGGTILSGLFAAAHLPMIAVSGAVFMLFAAFTIPRFTTLFAVVAMLPFAAFTQALLLLHPWESALAPAELTFGSLAIWIAFLTGAEACSIIERISRQTFRQQRIIEAQARAIDRERDRADQLLLDVLPAAIAERLKRDRSAIADGFEAVTVLFADIVGFTPLSQRLAPRELVALLNEVFSAFDEMARRHGLEKIKTIGDAYMVVGGLPEPRADHAAAVGAMALEMRGAIGRFGDGKLALRLGLHTGPAVAGVIGTSKYSYDLWGDTVNTASRMESHGAPGEIHVTDACRAALGEGFVLEARGVVEIKGKGPMHTWWLKGAA